MAIPYKKTEDPALAERIRRRDPTALRETVRLYLPQILRAARGAGMDPDAAEDLAQAVFVTFIEKAHRFEGRSLVRTWLFGILYRKIAEARRKQGRDAAMDDIDTVFEKRFDAAGSWTRPPRAVDAAAYDGELRREISGCLEQTPEKQRMAFVLREVEDLGSEEICNILDVTRTNLGVLLMRARNRLRECLESKGIAKE